eukprot:8703028-Pyramimonas_sp.AAC.1
MQQLCFQGPKAFPRLPPEFAGCHPLEGPPEPQPYLDVLAGDSALGVPSDTSQLAPRLDALY